MVRSRWLAPLDGNITTGKKMSLIALLGYCEGKERVLTRQGEVSSAKIALADTPKEKIGRGMDVGRIVVKLRGDVAPMMSARVLALVNSGYYNNGNWHRVEHDFVIQGAGPGTIVWAAGDLQAGRVTPASMACWQARCCTRC